jgi:Homeodomain-like domain
LRDEDNGHGQRSCSQGDDHAAAAAVPLDPAEQAELEHRYRYRTTRDAETRTRYQMVLLAAQGHTPPQIAQLFRRSPDTVRRVLKRYLTGGADAVPHRPHLGQPPHYPPTWEQELVRVAKLDPTRLAWTVRCGHVGCWPTTCTR